MRFLTNRKEEEKRVNGSTPFISQTQGRRQCTWNVALPLFLWPLHVSHTVTLNEDIPFPKDVPVLKQALISYWYLNADWLKDNPVLDLCLQASAKHPETFTPTDKSFFVINEAENLQVYQSRVYIYLSIMTESLLWHGKYTLFQATVINPTIIVNGQFPPLTASKPIYVQISWQTPSTHGSFFSPHIWDLIINENFCSALFCLPHPSKASALSSHCSLTMTLDLPQHPIPSHPIQFFQPRASPPSKKSSVSSMIANGSVCLFPTRWCAHPQLLIKASPFWKDKWQQAT